MREPAGPERDAWLTLALVPGIGCTRLAALLDALGSAEAVLRASARELCQVDGIGRILADAIRGADRQAGGRALARTARIGADLMVPRDPDYPVLLRAIPDPPPVLFLQGRRDFLTRPAVAIVGSRNHSRYGAEVCRALARAAAEAGLVVVSGMARGLDALAHLGALDAGGATIGVLGNGLDVVYPPQNRRLYQRVRSEGLLLSEFPPGERPSGGSFSRRNRIISGLARVIVVVEAAATSGTLGTVNHAHDQGRDVLVVPGPITSPVSAGTNGLLRDGAGPLLELRDLLDQYPELALTRSAVPAGEPPGIPVFDRLLATLRRQPLAADELVACAGVPVEQALQALSQLELRGAVRQEGGRYRVVVGLFT
ncbi:MAG: DNA-processing protein DprA [Gemmatimonadales bacterium]